MFDLGELRDRVQSELDNHLAIAATFQEKLNLIGQVESLAQELGLTNGNHANKPNSAPDGRVKVLTVPETKVEVVTVPEMKVEVVTVPEAKVEAVAVQDAKVEAPVVPAAQVDLATISRPANESAENRAAGTGSTSAWTAMHQGLQLYLAGKPDKALDMLRQARASNPTNFEKSWTLITSNPVYKKITNDKYFTEGLFCNK